MSRFASVAAAALLPCLFLLSGCADPPPAPLYRFEPPVHQVDYLTEVRPVLVKRCVICHSCYNSPCQLKLSSWEGLDRGASKEQVYNGSRLRTMEPSRLFIDAQTTGQWRERGFFPVTPEDGVSGYRDSILYLLLDHKRTHPNLLDPGKNSASFFSEDDDLSCAKTKRELKNYLRAHPNRGMPFGFPPLREDEFNTVVGWLSQGAPGPTPAQQQRLRAVDPADRPALERWEHFFNRRSAKHQMTARYLYEHLFLAHITFRTGSGQFFELVRSRTGPGEPIDLIATVRPYDDPGAARFFYRFRKIHSTIVFKTHMVFALDDRQYDLVQRLFIQPDWNAEPQVVGFAASRDNASPFITFAQIPAVSRYRWLLDNARYIVMTFIRGPVCKGQIALNVINDHFWLLFLDPDYDLSVRYPGFLKLHADNLRMPGESGSDYRLARLVFANPHYRSAVDYYRARQDFYAAHYPDGLPLAAIWPGEEPGDEPMLTVFRHFDSASVHRGALGNLPKSGWVIDYPLLERIYYALVAGFDVYGNVGHQLATRLYMDALRIEGESYFLDFLPGPQRQPLLRSWYEGVLEDELHYYPSPIPAAIDYRTDDPKREFFERVVTDRLAVPGIGFDHNYLPADGAYPQRPARFTTAAEALRGLISAAAPGDSFFKHVGDHNANLAWVRITGLADEPEFVVSAVIDRWHDNVKYLSREELRLDPERDRADFIAGFVGAYPNYFFTVDAADLPDLLDTLVTYDGGEASVRRLERFGVNRAEERFWEVYDWFQHRFLDSDPEQAGIIDLNRYYDLAMERSWYEGAP